ncbi:hypothetical protein [Gracilibacillus saliphilus]|nr:hypothetical protein [Gracilibacillus saliphilus]
MYVSKGVSKQISASTEEVSAFAEEMASIIIEGGFFLKVIKMPSAIINQ